MQIVLDTNEYIFTFGSKPEDPPRRLLEFLASVSEPAAYRVRIARTIVDEIRRNINQENFKVFWAFLTELEITVDEDWEVPFELGAKYEAMGLKRGDAFISAYTEWTGAEILITENRDFLNLLHLPFKILRAEQFLERHSS